MNAKLFASVAVIAVALCALGGVVLASDDSDAAGIFTGGTQTGSANDPYTGVNVDLGDTFPTIYVAVGSSVVVSAYEFSDGAVHVWEYPVDVSSGFGLSITSYTVSGIISKPGTITITTTVEENGDYTSSSRTIIAVDPEEDIDFISPSSVEGISGGSISYTARTNIDATFSEAGGTGASWLSVNSSTGVVSGTFPSVTTMTSYTYTIKATSESNSSNTATQTITIDVYPVARISATSTSISGIEDEAISSVTLTGNLDMSFSKSSGSFPAGVYMSSAGVISGTPTEDGSFTVVVRGTTTEGPTQNPTITIRFNIEAAEDAISITVADPAESYKVGESISLALTSNVEDTTWSVSGTAASFMSVSGSAVVGSVPSTYTDVTEPSLTVSAETPKGQTATKTVNISVEPVLTFTSVPTADCVITPVYDYNEDGTPVLSSNVSLLTEVWADGADFSFIDTLTICGTFTGTNADTVTWYWGDGASDVGNKVTHQYAEPGTYEIRLVASNDLGESEVTITVSVGDSGNDFLFYGIILVLVIVVIYLIYRIAAPGKRRGH